jgi:hypothetical protein
VLLIDDATPWTRAEETLDAVTTWPAGSRVAVTGNLTVPASGSLTIGAGTIVRFDPGVNLYVDGQLIIQGTVDGPAVFMPARRSQPWGGCFLRTATAAVTAAGTIFTGSGAPRQPGPHPGAVRRTGGQFPATDSVVFSPRAAVAGPSSADPALAAPNELHKVQHLR